ncbi:proline/serine-rich protein [Armillaria novae-zelandiae]|uniref:Proline/serine-rich protein n=1 Tax=Armillaria novae-zelandiae TaxID=153914 RepID=A0AA39UJR3_9AGAR|nr:proline/serine-rich protein [Armillaria novae-zelandiae]
MATPAPPHPIANGPVSGGPSTPRPRNWSRNGEPGSAFSGIGRGRRGNGGRGGRGGRGGGRGGRGGGGGAPKPADTPADPSPAPPSSTQPTKPIPSKLTPTQKQPSTTSPVTPTSAKAKSSSRRSSRNSPAANPPTPSTDVPPTPTSASRTSNRRHRPQNQPKAPKDVPKINAPPAASERPSRQRNRPAPLNAPPKAASPSPSNTNHRPDIDALVERVRASAMAEARPTTPGSHIDWAGDEDDTLPDLDDWGVKPKLPSEPHDSAISPIIVEGLTPLPDLVSKPSFTEHDGLSPSMASVYPPSSGSPRQMDTALPEESNKEEEASLKETDAAAVSVPPSLDVPIVSETEFLQPKPSVPVVDTPRAPLHPSLPPKPVSSVLSVNPRRSSAPMRNSRPPKNNKNGLSSNPAAQPKLIEQSKPTEQLNATETSIPTENSKPDLDQSLQPKPLLVVDPPKPGLEASMHAPKPGEPISAPSDITTYAASRNGPHAFNPAHSRNFTIGRQPPIQHPSPLHLNPRNARSGASTPRRGFVQDGYHARTHSSPPTVDNHRPHHTSRPVLTGDAISRLAKTIGRSSPRSMAVAAPKE